MAHRHELDSTLYDPVTFYNQNSLNLIVDERIKYDREYIILDRDKIALGIADPDQLLTIFNDYEIDQFLKQALEMDYITQAEYDSLVVDSSTLYDIVLMNDIHTLLYKQLTYITKIPAMEDLESNGLLDSIINVIQQNPDLTIDNPTVINYTDNYLLQLLNTTHFVSFNNAEYILDKPNDLLQIIPDQVIELLNRVKPFLSYITDDKINEIQTKIDNSNYSIDGIFSVNEIKLIIEKEIQLKYYILKALTPEKIIELFETFKQELIDIEIESLVIQHFDILKTEMMSVNYDQLIKDQVDNYLITSYNQLMETTINNAFERFKNEFIAIDLQLIIKGYFDEMADELFGQNYDQIIQGQVDTYLLNNTEVLTDIQIQQWIQQTI